MFDTVWPPPPPFKTPGYAPAYNRGSNKRWGLIRGSLRYSAVMNFLSLKFLFANNPFKFEKSRSLWNNFVSECLENTRNAVLELSGGECPRNPLRTCASGTGNARLWRSNAPQPPSMKNPSLLCDKISFFLPQPELGTACKSTASKLRCLNKNELFKM